MLHAVAFLVLLQATRRPALLAWGAAGAAALAVALFALTAHGAARVAVWRDPFGDATGRGWQVLQALAALYSGGLWGSGVGAGFPQAVPVAASDFIYVALGEELGFAGCAAVLGIYFALLRRALVPAFRREGGFGALLAGGLAAALGVQVLWNVAGVVKAVPLTGITLPFLSQGGSSLLTSFVALGLLMALSEGDEDRDANP
jgi:cell division protein FtsW (lipid II flippase)